MQVKVADKRIEFENTFQKKKRNIATSDCKRR